MAATSGTVAIGVVVRPHGVRGELKVLLHNPESRALELAEEVEIAGARYPVLSARHQRGVVLLRLGGLDDRNAAEDLRQAEVSVAREALELDDGEFLLADLIGARAQLPDGSDYGTVVDVIVGPQDRLLIRDGEIERELPVVDEFLLAVDLEAGTVIVDPPDGLPEWPARGG